MNQQPYNIYVCTHLYFTLISAFIQNLNRNTQDTKFEIKQREKLNEKQHQQYK